MQVIFQKSFFSLQKLFLFSDYKEYSGKYALVELNPELQCLVQIFCKSDINPRFCVLNKCVILCSNDKEHYVLRNITDLKPPDVKFDMVKFIADIDIIKNLTFTVVFKNAWFTSQWKSKTESFKYFLKEVLKLFVVAKKCFIFPETLEICRTMGIYCIIVHNSDVPYGRITSSTKICIDKLVSKNWYSTFETVEDISCDGSIYMQLREHCLNERYDSDETRVFPRFSHNILLVGPPGCGKTTLVHHVAFDCDFAVVTVSGPELCHPDPGRTEEMVRKVFEEARLLASERPDSVCIILLDQVDSVCGKRRTAHSVRVHSLILKLLDSLVVSRGVLVVATTDRPDALSPALRRPPRLSVELVMGVPSESERKGILRSACSVAGIDGSVCEEVAQWTPGYVAADLALVVSNVARRIDDSSRLVRNRETLLEIWRSCVNSMCPSTLRGELGLITDSGTNLSEIGGLDYAKKALRKAIEWPLFRADAFKRLGIRQSKGVLLYGPPGCGKTSLVRTVANGLGTTFLSASAATVYSPYVGDAERAVAHLFRRARLGAPSVLFIDEIDALVGGRGERQRGVQERVLSTLLTEMDGVGVRLDRSQGGAQSTQVVVVAATNRPHLLDPALVRPGRFDRLVYVGPPDAGKRLDILRKITDRMPLGPDVEIEYLADRTELFSGADLSRLCKEAALVAMHEEGMSVGCVGRAHWMAALASMKPSLTKQQVDLYENVECFR